MNKTIPTAIIGSGASSNVGATKDNFKLTGRKSDKIFWLPDSSTQAAMDIGELPYQVCQPAKDVHITPGISENSLVIRSKLADAGYITVFDKDTVKMYNTYNTQVIVTREAVINGWCNNKTGMWWAALLPIVTNVN